MSISLGSKCKNAVDAAVPLLSTFPATFLGQLVG